jgi:hypothetical protein
LGPFLLKEAATCEIADRHLVIGLLAETPFSKQATNLEPSAG